ncbi:hypothetical protein [Bacillus piscicola]|uniref:hypothetical protein n=1 Tax=Bacillus piscicola TaxID=1632684 RepID=UPI001F08E998|nr:hypothetical protein [Bacillus piscicola]
MGNETIKGNFAVQDLYELANEMSQKHWGIDYTDNIELVDDDWIQQNAVFIYDRKTRERTIQMSAKRNAGRSKDAVLKSLLHELVHWRLHSTGKPCRDEDPEFIEECLRVGASISLAKKAQLALEQFLMKEKTIG